MLKSRCPHCHSDVIVDMEAVEGDLVTCSNCEQDLEVLTLHPLQLDAIKEEQEN